MNLSKITFAQGKEGEAVPETVTVTMTLAEAHWIAKQAGRHTPSTDATRAIYDALVCDLFNRYWDDGVDGVKP